jgi:hypothetical protein
MNRLDTFPGNEIIQQYRQAFSTRAGQEVLKHMLFELGTFYEVADGEDSTLKNYGTRLLKILAGGEVDGDTIEQFTRRLMKQPLNKDKGE